MEARTTKAYQGDYVALLLPSQDLQLYYGEKTSVVESTTILYCHLCAKMSEMTAKPKKYYIWLYKQNNQREWVKHYRTTALVKERSEL